MQSDQPESGPAWPGGTGLPVKWSGPDPGRISQARLRMGKEFFHSALQYWRSVALMYIVTVSDKNKAPWWKKCPFFQRFLVVVQNVAFDDWAVESPSQKSCLTWKRIKMGNKSPQVSLQGPKLGWFGKIAFQNHRKGAKKDSLKCKHGLMSFGKKKKKNRKGH
jgi:hypothetical protein